MRNVLLLGLVLSFIPASPSNWQKSDLYGRYQHSVGEPGRTIKREDGSEVHLGPIIYSRDILILRRWGRCEMESCGMDGQFFPSTKGRWDLEGDSVIIYFPNQSRMALLADERGDLIQEEGRIYYQRILE